MAHILEKDVIRLGRLAAEMDFYRERVRKLPSVGFGWRKLEDFSSVVKARAKANKMLGSYHVAIMYGSYGPYAKAYEVWVSEVTGREVHKAPKDAMYITRRLDYTKRRPPKPHNYYKRV